MTTTILLPGTLCDGAVFEAIVPRLRDSRTLDFRDCDRAEAAADRLAGQLPERFVGIAFSLGGWVLLEIARRFPQRVIGLALLSGNAFPDDLANAAIRRGKVDAARRSGLTAMVAADWPGVVGSAARDDTRLRDTVAEMAERCGHEVHARQAELNIHRPDRRDTIAVFPWPVLVVAGTEDRLCPVERYEHAASGPGGRLKRLPGVGHYVPLEAPEAVTAAVASMFPEAVR